MADCPFSLFDAWLQEAKASELNDYNAMCLATATPAGKPSARMVLLKGHDERGFVFYTNNTSRKAGELQQNQHVSLCFHWKSLRKQVRIEGMVTPVADAEADAYFATRSRDSQLGAWASQQSSVLENRAIFEQQYQAVKQRYEGQTVPRPPHWSGWRVVPEQIEFWQDGAHRLHHRTVYTKSDGTWNTHKLYP